MTDTTGRQDPSEPGDPGSGEHGPTAYATTWLTEESLDSLNSRIHDGVPVAQLLDRARSYRDRIFDTYPLARPHSGARVMELGSGVGWIMEAVIERFSPQEIVGLDISANMIARAQERFSHPSARFELYDGFHMPFSDSYFDVVYSVAAAQHIEKHVAFLLFEELHRVLAPGGHAIVHLLAVDHIPRSEVTYHEECWNHIDGVPTHWHHYYSFDELFVLFSEAIGVDELDIRYQDDSFLVHFSKDTGRRYLDPGLPSLRLQERLKWRPESERDAAEPGGAAGRAASSLSTRTLARALALRVYQDTRARLARLATEVGLRLRSPPWENRPLPHQVRGLSPPP